MSIDEGAWLDGVPDEHRDPGEGTETTTNQGGPMHVALRHRSLLERASTLTLQMRLDEIESGVAKEGHIGLDIEADAIRAIIGERRFIHSKPR